MKIEQAARISSSGIMDEREDDSALSKRNNKL